LAVSADGSAAAALAEIDKALAGKPRIDGHALSAAAHHLSVLRNGMAEEQREHGETQEARRRLEHVNAVISVVLGVHFPLGSTPWPELEKARDWLVNLTDEEAVKD
jgi:hypothetical protein